MKSARLLLPFTLIFLFASSTFAQEINPVQDKKIEAEKRWAEFDLNKLKKELQTKTSATDEELEVFFSIQENYLYEFQQDFFHLVFENKLSKKVSSFKYTQLLDHFISEYGKFEVSNHSGNGKKGKGSEIELKTTGCVNADFEDGTTSGWDGYAGSASSAINPSGLVPGFTRISVVTGNGFDSYVGGNILPHVAPGGTYSVRLEDQNNGSRASRLSQTFLVQPSNANFTYKYAVVLENGFHGVSEQAYFKVRVKDQNGNLISCVYDSLTPTSPFTGLTMANNGYYFRNWTTKTIPLGSYIGQNVTIEFTASDCTQGGHFGYAYVDGSCLPLEITSSSMQVCPGSNVTLTAPAGYDSYFWTGPGIVGDNTGQTIIANQPGTYQANIAIGSCFSPVVINLTGGGITGTALQLCSGDTTTLHAPSGFTSYAWTGPGIVGAGNTNSVLVNQPGTYNLAVTGGFGGLCNSSYEISPIINPLAGPDINMCAGDTVQLEVTGGSTEFQWTPTTSMLFPTTSHPLVFPNVTTTYVATTCNVTDTITVNVVNAISGTITGDLVNCNVNGVPIGIAMNGEGDYIYSWSPATGLSSDNEATVLASPHQNTVYTVSVSLGNNCAYTDSVEITVPLIASFAASPHIDSICIGNSVQLNAVYQKSCGLNGSVCSGPLSNGQLGSQAVLTSTTNETIYTGTQKSARFQLLITKAELNALGINSTSTLSQFGFKIISISGSNIYQNFTIKMGCSALSDLTTSYEEGLYEVFSPKNVVLTAGINYYQLDNTFDWDGNSNLLVEVCYNNASTSANSSIYYSTSSFQSFLATSSASACNTLVGTLSAKRPNVFFKYCATPVLNPITYVWSPAATLSDADIPNPMANPASEMTYYVVGTDSVSGCIYQDSVKLAVGDFFSLSMADTIVNCNSSGTLLSVFTSQSGNYTYSWSPAGSISNPGIYNPVAIPLVSTTYQVIVSSDLGCSLKDSVRITVPVLSSFYVTPSTASICTGQSVQINSIYQKSCGVNGNTCSGASTAVQLGTTTSNSSANNITLYKGSSNGSRIQLLYTKTELNAAGINNATTLSHIGFNIASIVGNNIYQNFTIKMTCTDETALTTTFQTGLQTVFNTKNVILSNGVNYYTFDNLFDWDGLTNLLVEICYNNASVSSNSAVFYSNTTSTSVTYLTGNLVCGGLTGSTTSSRPTTYFKYCTGQTDDILDFQWTPVLNLSDATISNPVASPAQNTIYYVSATDTSNGCIFSDSVLVFVSQNSVLNLGSDTLICSGQGVTLDAGSGFNSYLWSNGSTGSSLLVSSPGTYWVRGTNSCGIHTDTCIVGVKNLPANIDLGNDTTICSALPLTFSALNPGFTSYIWQDGSINPTFTASQNGTYWVSAFNECGMKTDSIVVGVENPLPVIFGNDTSFCQPNTLLLDPGNSYSSYLWQNGATTQNFLVSATGTYYVTASNLCGNFSDTIAVLVDTAPDIDLGPDVTTCMGNTVVLTPSGCSNCSYTWQDNSVSNTYSASSAGLYVVSASNFCGTNTDSLVVAIGSPVPLNLGNDTLICQSDVLIIDPGNSYSSYLWQNGDTTRTFTVTGSGIYSLVASNICGTFSDSITVFTANGPDISLGADTLICAGSSLVLSPTGCADCSYEWQDNSTNPDYTANTTGLYVVTATNFCGQDIDSIQLGSIALPVVSLGADTSFCSGRSFVASTLFDPAYQYLWQNGSSNNFMTLSSVGTYWVRVSTDCGSVTDTLKIITLYPPPQLDLGNDTVICEDNIIQVNAGQNINGTYLWQDNSNQPFYMVSAPGSYWLRYTDTNSCVSSDTLHISGVYKPLISLGNDLTICKGSTYVLQMPVNSNSYVWQNGSTGDFFLVNQTGIYSVTATNQCGSMTDVVIIQEKDCECHIDVPTAFSPNEDGSNEILFVRGNCVTELDFYIYDRWGEKVFESHELTDGWDGTFQGKKLDPAVFNYYLSATLNSNVEKVEKKGNISLIK